MRRWSVDPVEIMRFVSSFSTNEILMFAAFLIFVWFTIIAGLAIWWQSIRQKEAAYERFAAAFESRGETEMQYPGRRLRRRWMWVPWAIGIVAAIFVIGQFIEGNILTPKLVGKSVGLHPVWLLVALSVFGSVFGFVGLLVAVPVAAAIGAQGARRRRRRR